jgi:hypothetical protein
MADTARMSGRGVWELLDDSGGRIHVHLGDGALLDLGFTDSSARTWQPLLSLGPVAVGQPVRLWTSETTNLHVRRVASWRPLPDRVLLDDGGVVVSNGVIRQVHNRADCAGRESCWIHRPSEHRLRAWPIFWRADAGKVERLCPHGVGHPDPDDATYLISIGRRSADVHGCDGCCLREGE